MTKAIDAWGRRTRWRPACVRFWEKVDRSGDCWLWTGSRSAKGIDGREAPLQCRHCGVRIIHAPGHSGRYRYTDNLSGTDIFGSGSECPKNEQGHEPQRNDGSES